MQSKSVEAEAGLASPSPPWVEDADNLPADRKACAPGNGCFRAWREAQRTLCGKARYHKAAAAMDCARCLQVDSLSRMPRVGGCCRQALPRRIGGVANRRISTGDKFYVLGRTDITMV